MALICNSQAHPCVNFDTPAFTIKFVTTGDVTKVVINNEPVTISGDYSDYDLKLLLASGVKLDKVDLSLFSTLSVSEQNQVLEQLGELINKFNKSQEKSNNSQEKSNNSQEKSNNSQLKSE